MGDVTADYFVEQQRLKVQIQSLNTNLQRSMLEIMEMDSRRLKSITNIEATRAAIAEAEENLSSLVEEHGEAPAFKL